MAKAKQDAQQSLTFTNLRDCGARFAATDDSRSIFAKYCIEQGVNPDAVTDEQRADLNAGFLAHYASTHPAVKYLRDGDQYIPVTGDAPAGREVVSIGVEYAMNFSTYDYGRLPQKQKSLYDLVKPLRDRFTNYTSQKMGRLMSAIRAELAGEGGGRKRNANASFDEYLKKLFPAMEKRNANARKKGDVAALPDNVLKEAVAAFQTVVVKYTLK